MAGKFKQMGELERDRSPWAGDGEEELIERTKEKDDHTVTLQQLVNHRVGTMT